MKFSNNWFDVTARANFEKYILPLKELELNFLEVGCYEGRASVWLMGNTNSKLTVVDTFQGSKEHSNEGDLYDRFSSNTAGYRDRITVEVGRSAKKLKKFESALFDFIYIDGSHQASDVLEDAVLAFPLLKKGGIMIFDDYTWGAGLPVLEVPAVGINAFLFIYSNQLEELVRNSQVVIKKL